LRFKLFIIRQKVKKIEKIEVSQEYIKLLTEQKKFEIKSKKVFDFENFLIPYYTKNSKLKISKTVKMSYLPTGHIIMHESYFKVYINNLFSRMEDNI
jgi:hypothetical protein